MWSIKVLICVVVSWHLPAGGFVRVLCAHDGYLAIEGDSSLTLLADMKAELSVQGPCWTRAVERLEKNRWQITERQERLAFAFMNCFIEGAGVSGYSCRETELLSNCKDFIRMQNSPHKNVYAVYFLQSQLVVAYLKELSQQREASQQLQSRQKSSVTLASRLASTSDLLLESIKAEGEIAELKRLAIQSQDELREGLHGAGRVIAQLGDLVTQYKVVGVTAMGVLLYATNFVIGRIF